MYDDPDAACSGDTLTIELSLPKIELWIWQTEHSPHIASLVREISRLNVTVRFIVQRAVSEERKALGWPDTPESQNDLSLVPTKQAAHALLEQSGMDVIHLLQGVRGNGYISDIMRTIFRTDRRCLVLMEPVNDKGIKGALKRAYYFAFFRRFRKSIDAILAIGKSSRGWLADRGFPVARAFEFAYFLAHTELSTPCHADSHSKFLIIYAGQLIHRKRVDLLFDGLAILSNKDVELKIVGDGPLREELEILAAKSQISDVKWSGALPMELAQKEIAEADCLVLPSDFDGWGAVISEALAYGTKVICSDRCGAATLVEASHHGFVFKSDDATELAKALDQAIEEGVVSEEVRGHVRQWATYISAKSGATYLRGILDHVYSRAAQPEAPWKTSSLPPAEAPRS